MIKVDVSVFIQIANFLVLVWALNQFLYRPIRRMLKERKDKVGGLESIITGAERGCEEKSAAYRDGLKSVRLEAAGEKAELIQAAEEEEKRLIAQIHEKTQADLSSVKAKIAKDAEAARQALLKDIDGFATQITEKILGRAV